MSPLHWGMRCDLVRVEMTVLMRHIGRRDNQAGNEELCGDRHQLAQPEGVRAAAGSSFAAPQVTDGR